MTDDERDAKIIEKVAAALGMTFKKDEEHRFIVDGFEITSPKNEEEEAGLWRLYGSTFIPGVRYRSDGSGEPDDVDVFEIGEGFLNLGLLIAELGKHRAQQLYELEAENIAFEAFSPDDESAILYD